MGPCNGFHTYLRETQGKVVTFGKEESAAIEEVESLKLVQFLDFRYIWREGEWGRLPYRTQYSHLYSNYIDWKQVTSLTLEWQSLWDLSICPYLHRTESYTESTYLQRTQKVTYLQIHRKLHRKLHVCRGHRKLKRKIHRKSHRKLHICRGHTNIHRKLHIKLHICRYTERYTESYTESYISADTQKVTQEVTQEVTFHFNSHLSSPNVLFPIDLYLCLIFTPYRWNTELRYKFP